MKEHMSKKIIQKIVISLVCVISINFIIPNYSHADAGGVLFSPIRTLLVAVGDAVISGLQKFFVGGDAIYSAAEKLKDAQSASGETPSIGDSIAETVLDFANSIGISSALTGEQDTPQIKYSPGIIFSNRVAALKINYLKGSIDEAEVYNVKANSITTDWKTAYKQLMEQYQTYYNNSQDELEKKVLNNVILNLGAKIESDIIIYDIENEQSESYNTIASRIKAMCQIYYEKTSNAVPTAFGLPDEINPTDEVLTIKKELVDGTRVPLSYGLLCNIFLAYHNLDQSRMDLNYIEESPVVVLHNTIATWYTILRNIAVVALLSVLVYIGIKIVISSTAQEKSKYKSLIYNWLVALCMVFVLHYFMSFTIAIIETISNILYEGCTITNDSGDSLFNLVRLGVQTTDLGEQFFFTLLYIVLVIYTVIFTVYYLKRTIYIAFLILIAPLICVSYPLDKIGDGKSQAFDLWMKEFVLNVAIQPVHLFIYIILVSSAENLVMNNPIYAVVVIGAMLPIEKFFKEMFGFDKTKDKGPGSFAAGAMAMNAISSIAKFGKSHGGPQKGGKPGEQGQNKVRTQDDSPTNKIQLKEGFAPTDTDNSISQNESQAQPSERNKYDTKPESLDNGETPQLTDLDSGENNSSQWDLGAENSNYNSGASLENANGNMNFDTDSNTTTAPEINSSGESSTSNNTTSGEKVNKQTEKSLTKGQKRLNGFKKMLKPRYDGNFGEDIKKLGKGVATTLGGAALGVAGGAALGTAALAAGISTGDVGNAAKYTATGVAGGAAMGNAVGRRFTSSSINSVGNAISRTRQDYREGFYGSKKDARIAEIAKNFKKNKENRDYFKEQFNTKNTKDLNNVMEKAAVYNSHGITDLKDIKKGIKLENAHSGTKNEVSTEQAILVMKQSKYATRDVLVDNKKRNNYKEMYKNKIGDQQANRLLGLLDEVNLDD